MSRKGSRRARQGRAPSLSRYARVVHIGTIRSVEFRGTPLILGPIIDGSLVRETAEVVTDSAEYRAACLILGMVLPEPAHRTTRIEFVALSGSVVEP